MNPLKEAIALMEKEDIRAFKLFANRTEKEAERRDLALFDHVKQSGNDYDEDKAYHSLYANTSKNTFHRLKSRLLSEINRSLVNQYLDKYDVLRLFHFLSVVEFYMQQRHYELAHWFLRKAERLAIRIEHLEMLDVIYTTYTRLANEGMIAEPQVYIQKRRENRTSLQKLRELDDVLLMVKHRLKTTQTYGSRGSDVMELLEDTVAEYASEGQQRPSTSFRIKMFQAISQILLDKRDYATLETYSKSTFEEFEKEDLFNRSNHQDKLMILTFLVNSLYKNEKFTESLHFAGRLHAAMKAHDRMLYDRYLFFYYNAVVLNYLETDLDKGQETLEEMLQQEAIQETPFYVLFAYINLALIQNQRGNYREAVKNMVQAYLLPGYKSAGPGLQLRLIVAELMLRYELGEYEVILQRIRHIEKNYGELIRDREFIRERTMVNFIQQMNEDIEPRRNKPLKSKVQRFLRINPTEEELDSEVIDYRSFLKRHFE